MKSALFSEWWSPEMGDDWVDVGAEVYEDDEDEFEYLAPPDLDPDYLDEKDGDEGEYKLTYVLGPSGSQSYVSQVCFAIIYE